MNRYEFEEAVLDTLDSIAVMLMEKNESYGNAAIDPLRVFSKDDNVAQLKVRIDDKLSRIQRGNDTFPEDTVRDLVGYLVLLLIAETPEETEVQTEPVWLKEDPNFDLLDEDAGLAEWERELLAGTRHPLVPKLAVEQIDVAPNVATYIPPKDGTVYLINTSGATPA